MFKVTLETKWVPKKGSSMYKGHFFCSWRSDLHLSLSVSLYLSKLLCEPTRRERLFLTTNIEHLRSPLTSDKRCGQLKEEIWVYSGVAYQIDYKNMQHKLWKQWNPSSAFSSTGHVIKYSFPTPISTGFNRKDNLAVFSCIVINYRLGGLTQTCFTLYLE